MTRRVRQRTLAGLVAAACAAALVWQAVGSATAEQAGAIDWKKCGTQAKCATLTVPSDWSHPDGPKTKINLKMLPAADPARSKGTVLANFGAGSSTPALDNPPPGVRALHRTFDLVSFDPRGLGVESNGTLVKCAKTTPPYDGLFAAKNRADWDAYAKRNAEHADSCRAAMGAGYAGLTSWQVAHDMDAIREGLGRKRIRYLGNSYGTAYGQAYAELFTDRVERMYLDGVADHTQTSTRTWLRHYATTQERQLRHFADWCAGRDGCALHGSDVEAVWTDLVSEAGRRPLPAPGAGEGRTVDLAHLYMGAHYGMTPPLWPELAAAMDEARHGDAGDFLTELAEPPGETFGSVQPDILCHDFLPHTPSYAAALDIERRMKKVAPRFGWLEVRAELGRCVGMDGEPSFAPHRLRVPGLPRTLVAIGDLDANTPNLGAEAVAAQLPDASVVRHGDGHAAMLLGNTCLIKLATKYLADGSLPPRGTRCPGELVGQLPDHP
ncbi:MAG TPA: alpha/beta fold hydrolase [Stackebrandtia sp.]|jgi:pimeloyl-ACP methyl ester carboxylesterase|uniref:alpha/beta fold hydrolase n=1 Tax=Stackebrandtia sp. TaxID=2023065 RepID=UPI002D391A97|nr:alpha/beta fold hydrolase [Stackebrandtia sp.]HZE37362.1 alpha/beta fold hydrolase [Stackebrandtia sp.]